MILSPYQKPPVGSKINPKHPFSKGLAGLWLMNEMSGDRVWDYSGNGNHGTCMNMSPQSATSGWGPGPHGGALAFDGGNNCVNCGNNNSLHLLNCFTVVGWASTNILSGTYMLATRRKSVDSWWEIIQRDNKFGFEVYGSSGTKNTPVYTIPAIGIQHQFAAILNVPTIFLYIDGALIGSISGVSNLTIPPTDKIYISSYDASPPGAYSWNGLISSVSIYNRALSADEIAILYARPFCMFEDEGFPAWMVPPASAQHYYRQLLAGGR